MQPLHTPIPRRRFLQQSALGLGLGLSSPALLAASPAPGRSGTARAAQEAHVFVFQGDSITDAGRDKDDQVANASSSLGRGYVALAASQLLGEYPESNWQCFNRGISGNKVFQLAERWDADCLELNPNVLSILIGVNDYWHTLRSGYDGTVEVYESDYRALLDRTRETLPGVKLILAEPFAVEGGTAIDDAWMAGNFPEYQAAAKRVAQDYDAAWIPLQSIFDEALKKAPVAYWCPDGVHPAPAGNNLNAQAWLDANRHKM
jgi:lysophospholipase L1-like esterase